MKIFSPALETAQLCTHNTHFGNDFAEFLYLLVARLATASYDRLAEAQSYMTTYYSQTSNYAQ